MIYSKIIKFISSTLALIACGCSRHHQSSYVDKQLYPNNTDYTCIADSSIDKGPTNIGTFESLLPGGIHLSMPFKEVEHKTSWRFDFPTDRASPFYEAHIYTKWKGQRIGLYLRDFDHDGRIDWISITLDPQSEIAKSIYSKLSGGIQLTSSDHSYASSCSYTSRAIYYTTPTPPDQRKVVAGAYCSIYESCRINDPHICESLPSSPIVTITRRSVSHADWMQIRMYAFGSYIIPPHAESSTSPSNCSFNRATDAP